MVLEYIGKSIRPLKSCSAHRHKEWELIYNETGTGVMLIEGTEHTFEEGSIMLFPPGTVHQKIANSQFEDYYIRISNCELAPKVYCFSTNQKDDVLQLLKIMHRCYHENGQDQVCSSLLASVMGILLTDHHDLLHDANVSLMQRMMIERFADADFTVGDVFKAFSMNEDYLRRRFKAYTGVSPHAYLENLRIENAKKLLAQSQGQGMTISDVAYLSGFYDVLYFSKVFKKRVGVPPSRWKTKAM